MQNKYPNLRFAISQGMMVLSGTIYGVVFLFLVQRYVASELGNSLFGNIGVFISVISTLFIGHFVDHYSPWKIILISNLILAPVSLFPLIFYHKVGLFIVILAVTDIISALFGELDSIARTSYVGRVTTRKNLAVLQQYISVINSAVAITGYLLIFLTVSFIPLTHYLVLCGGLYILSVLVVLTLPKEQHQPVTKDASNDSMRQDFQKMFHFIKSQHLSAVFTSSIFLTIRNQVIFSLIIYKLGQIDPGFHHILIIGAGLIISVLSGSLMNKLLSKISNAQWLKRLVFVLAICSAFFTFVSGNYLGNLPSFFAGMAIGFIFAFTIPVYACIETERIAQMDNTMQGKSMAFIHFCSIILTIVITLVLGIVQQIFKIDAIYFDFAALITFLLPFVLSKVKFNLSTNE